MNEKHGYQWAPNLPHMEVRRFIAERLRTEQPSQALDLEVCRLLGCNPLPLVTSELSVAVRLIPNGWWWHISHLQAKVIPTVQVEGAPLSNGTLYDFYGKPVGFTAMCWSRDQLPAALCEALLKARYDLPTAFVVSASESAHNDFNSRMAQYSHERHHPPPPRSKIRRILDVLRDEDDH